VAATAEVEDSCARAYFGYWELKPEDVNGDSIVYVGRVTPAVHFTMGGVIINQLGEVMDEKEVAIEGAWAAGEVTGGIHGENRLGGSSLLECVVFGRIAGQGVVRHLEA
jgi:FAD-dependent fumarate reductase